MSCIMRDCAKWVFTFSILFYRKIMLLFTRYILAKELLAFFLERRPWFIIQPMLIARSNFTLEFGMSISMLNFFHDWKCKEKAICSCAFWYQDGEKQNKKWPSRWLLKKANYWERRVKTHFKETVIDWVNTLE